MKLLESYKTRIFDEEGREYKIDRLSVDHSDNGRPAIELRLVIEVKGISSKQIENYANYCNASALPMGEIIDALRSSNTEIKSLFDQILVLNRLTREN